MGSAHNWRKKRGGGSSVLLPSPHAGFPVTCSTPVSKLRCNSLDLALVLGKEGSWIPLDKIYQVVVKRTCKSSHRGNWENPDNPVPNSASPALLGIYHHPREAPRLKEVKPVAQDPLVRVHLSPTSSDSTVRARDYVLPWEL